MNEFLSNLWQSIYYTAFDFFNFILWQAWLALGLLVIFAAAKIFEWKAGTKKSRQEKEQ